MKNAEIIIVNDDPETSLSKQVEQICPQARLIQNQQNLGFGLTMNKGVEHSTGELLLFLNSDVRLSDSSFQDAAVEFENEQLFALSLAQIDNDGNLSVANQGAFREGLFQHSTKAAKKITTTLWPDGGSSLVRRRYFQELGGFDPRFSPFYWEDVDLGYRAQKKGYLSLYYPKVVVEHHHATTINKYFAPDSTRAINYRNQFLFTWKHANWTQWLLHLVYLPVQIVKMRKDRAFLKGLTAAIEYVLNHR